MRACNLFVQSDSQHREEINKFYEPGPPTLSPMDGEGYESISYEVDGMKRLSMKVGVVH